jgi:hypothetical protein
LRSNQPRVYVIAHLGGGSGSGMFLDLAYLIHAQLSELGYARGEVIGLFFLPDGEPKPTPQALANGMAALIELHHFSAPQTTFAAEYAKGPLRDAAAPFHRWCVLSSRRADAEPTPQRAAEFLFCELTTSLARRGEEPPSQTQAFPSADTAPDVPRQVGLPGPPLLGTFGIHRFAWPRRKVVKHAGRELALKLVQAWLDKDAGPSEKTVRDWLIQRWTEQGLAAQALIEHLEKSSAVVLGAPPRDAFRSRVESVFRPRDTAPWGGPAAVVDLLADIDRLLGRGLGQGGDASPLLMAFAEASAAWESTAADSCWKLLGSILDLPGFRFAAADVVLRLMRATLRETRDSSRTRAADLAARADQEAGRLRVLLGEVSNRRGAARLDDLSGALRRHIEQRYESYLLSRVSRVHQRLDEMLADGQRDLDEHRHALTAVPQELESKGRSDDGDDYVEQEVQQFLTGLTDRDHEDLDREFQSTIDKQYESLAALCAQTSWGNRFQHLATSLRKRAEVFVQDRVGFPDVLDKFQARYPTAAIAKAALVEMFATASAALGPAAAGSRTTCVVALPASPHRGDVWELARSAAAPNTPAAADSMNDLVVYLEQESSFGAIVEYIGVAARAYQQAVQQGLSPHCRRDVDWVAMPNDAGEQTRVDGA